MNPQRVEFKLPGGRSTHYTDLERLPAVGILHPALDPISLSALYPVELRLRGAYKFVIILKFLTAM